MTPENILNFSNILIFVSGTAFTFVIKSIFGKIDGNAKSVGERITKLEENSRRDDDIVKNLLLEAEDRVTQEMDRRIKNVVELHRKIEDESRRLYDKHENNVKEIFELKGKVNS